MNTVNILSESQQDSRTQKGYNLFLENKVSRLNQREYEVIGSKGNTYIVEDLTTKEDIEPFLKCSCPDHVYRGVECYHIVAVTFKQMERV